MPSTRRLRVALFLAITSSACARMHSPPLPEDDTDVVTINVINHNFLSVSVYNLVQGHRERLGEVTSSSQLSVRLPLRRIIGGEMQLYADPVGSTRSVTSEMIHVSAGDSVEWTLESDLARSHLTIH